MPVLTLITTASVQDYIFRSNRLRENLGASGLVRYAMKWWFDHRRDKVLFVGGGNAALLFPSRQEAGQAIFDWSVMLLSKAAGLRVVVHHEEYEEGSLPEAFHIARQALIIAENRHPSGIELGALPVVRACPSTGLAASEPAATLEPSRKDEDTVEDFSADDESPGVWLSAEAQAKRNYYYHEFARAAGERYRDALRSGETQYLFPKDLESIGTVEGASQVALVHADGNGIGKIIGEEVESFILRRPPGAAGRDREFKKAIADLSGQITSLAERAFKKLLIELVESLPALETDGVIALKKHPKRKNAVLLPFRPVVDDGDDLTFICQGRLGISLAERYLRLFEENASAAFGRQLTACAGVLIMPKKFPFAQAYQLVEQLCASAKQARRSHPSTASWLDVHVLKEGRDGSLETIRAGQKPIYGGPLRPWSLNDGDDPRFSDFQATWTHHERIWPRHQSKRLLETYPSGERAVRALLEDFEKRGHSMCAGLQSAEIWDALDLMDFYYDLHLGGTRVQAQD